ncbi:MAG TPA: glutamine--fructose-6-phosphate transaminase (isomerizing) [Actinomycetota bacterium]|nr:glutamine--fructose-6-phosphate transaminase (isomerizing) [Actinomycetota bacterium]
MCGIVGYVGSGNALPVLLDGMEALEYRGYDSAGISVIDDDAIGIERRAGRLQNLRDALDGRGSDGRGIQGSIGIGHTRWATHGAPTDENAHPHSDCTGRVALVHNGIIENHDVLRSKLEGEGHVFGSETDTEVAAHLIESILADGRTSLLGAVTEAVGILEGAFALVCVSLDDPDVIVTARQEPPIIVGAANGVGLVGSDIPALLAHTRDVIPLDNRQIAEVRAGSVRVFDFEGNEVEPRRVHIDWDLDAAEKGGFDDFMLKEIFEQPDAVRNTMRGRLDAAGHITLDEVHWDNETLRRIDKIVVVACGTSFNAGMAAKHAIEHWTRIPVELDLASEFRYRDPVLDDTGLVIGITQSGETADTLAAVRFAKEMGAKVVAVTNVVGSSITRDADAVLFTHAGPEIGVAATKTFLAQLVALNLLALYLAQERDAMPRDKLVETIEAMNKLPEQLIEVLAIEQDVKEAASRYSSARDFIFIGRGVGTAVALEGALKLKEISYIHAEGYAAGELKHGPIALLQKGVPVVAVMTGAPLYEKMLANVEEVRARGASTILVAPKGDERARKLADDLFEVPATKPLLTPILDTVPLQFLAYFITKERGLSPDKPRNLAKSVTVE